MNKGLFNNINQEVLNRLKHEGFQGSLSFRKNGRVKSLTIVSKQNIRIYVHYSKNYAVLNVNGKTTKWQSIVNDITPNVLYDFITN